MNGKATATDKTQGRGCVAIPTGYKGNTGVATRIQGILDQARTGEHIVRVR